MSLSPTQLTLRHLRKDGWQAEVVEHWNPHARRRVDLFGFVDVLAVGEQGTIAVQATTAANVSSRVKKINEHENRDKVLAAGWKVVVYGWEKRKGRWVLAREVKIT